MVAGSAWSQRWTARLRRASLPEAAWAVGRGDDLFGREISGRGAGNSCSAAGSSAANAAALARAEFDQNRQDEQYDLDRRHDQDETIDER